MASQSVTLDAKARNFFLGVAFFVCAAAMMLYGARAFAAEPTLQQVYAAAEAGNYKAAQDMMDQVLRDHPNSAKAHFVEAELLAKQGQLAKAKEEFGTTEHLDPALSFAKPGAVQELKGVIAGSTRVVSAAAPLQAAQPHGLPWGLIIVTMALVGAIVFFMRARRQAQSYMPAAAGGYGAAPGYGPQTYGPNGPVGPMGPAPSGGMGSGILGGLATGAAVGAGMVAGEALMHRVLDGGNHAAGNNFAGNDLTPFGNGQSDYDMGGNDFGVSDASSWDDSSSGGGGDW